MNCPLCASSNEVEFPTERNIHVGGLRNLNRPSVFLFPKILVCLDCGSSRFTILETELREFTLLRDA